MWEDPFRNEIMIVKFLERGIRLGESRRANIFSMGYGHGIGGRALIHKSAMDILLGNLHYNLKINLMGKTRSDFLDIKGN